MFFDTCSDCKGRNAITPTHCVSALLLKFTGRISIKMTLNIPLIISVPVFNIEKLFFFFFLPSVSLLVP